MEILKLKNPHQETLKMLAEARHDMINHLQVIHAYAKLNKTEKIYDYIDSIARDYQMQSRVSKIGDFQLAATLIAMMLRFPELQFDFYGHSNQMKLSEYVGVTEEQAIDTILRTVITLASQEQGANEVQIIISTDESKKVQKRKISFSLYSKQLVEQKKPIMCLKNTLAIYGVELCQMHQDTEVFEWQLIFN